MVELISSGQTSFLKAASALKDKKRLHLPELIAAWRGNGQVPSANVWLPEIVVYHRHSNDIYAKVIGEDVHGMWNGADQFEQLLTSGIELDPKKAAEFGEVGRVYQFFRGGMPISESGKLASALEGGVKISDLCLKNTEHMDRPSETGYFEINLML